MSSSANPIFGNFSSLPPTAKSPKSPKGTIIENPLMKNAQFSFGGSALVSSQRTTTTALQAMPRSPLMALTPNRDDNNRHQQELKKKTRQIATPGPPPKMSLSLTNGMAMPMQTKPGIANEPKTTQQEQLFDTKKTGGATTTPIPVASPPLLKKESDNDLYFSSLSRFSSESLVADHWVVAHGYTSSNEYEELLRILSSYGTIQKQEAGGNWLAVLYESRLSAEKALVSQTILLKNTLCGITRGTPSLLQSLSSSKGEKQHQNVTQGGEKVLTQSASDDKRYEYGRGSLKERDILMLENSAYESRKPINQNRFAKNFTPGILDGRKTNCTWTSHSSV
eukprot:CAMPEP_0197185030 /NCGR_PEP_ID=MMETSP1423-20130617/11088_1 /TAXON_ID=476441 /ORGANISM="Pseudo-nitzschia heimii, Strain UNC1101" /LENGTH=336 /DNA_ID=CAMNT_0042635993 /DNA_START=120 /DNA_END=1131 /DNA_ORIENTATION=+